MPTIHIEDERFEYTDAGSGIAVVFVPGLCGSNEWFCYQSAGLSDHFRIITTNLRRADKRNYSLDRLANDIAGLLTALRIHSAAVVGHNLGGLVALQFALTHTNRCLAVVLSSTMPSYASVTEDQIISDMMLGELRPSGFWAKLLRKVLRSSTPLEDTSNPLTYLARHNGDIDRSTLTARLKLMRETDLTASLGKVGAPALIVAGSREQPYALAGCQLLEQELPDSSLEVIEGADQFHFYLAHDQFNLAVAEFLTRKISRP
ncbi:MAG: alpha/beta hydrolase [Armatimonadetes bacterium]|nr:alpha/beta hydrolase [Armatimonadota bacterium]